MKCDSCGIEGASLAWEGYTSPLPDVAPAYSEWQQLWLCSDCHHEMFPTFDNRTINDLVVPRN